MFKTDLLPAPSPQLVNLKDRILLIGSCFAEVIGKKLVENKFSVLQNPFGVIFNPLSIFKLLNYAIEKRCPPENSYLRQGDVFLNYDFHSAISSLSTDDLKGKIKNVIAEAHDFLKRCDWLVLSLGTAFIYRKVEDGEIVANCHKVPAKKFAKELLAVDEIKRQFNITHANLKQLNPGLKIILTVSPVRHLRDSLELNAVSKSTLRLFTHQVSPATENVHYFPSCEILLDDLRDYRFYKKDLIHPSPQAEDYIWDKFTHAYLDKETSTFLEKWKKTRTALEHRPLHPSSSAHQQFLMKTLDDLKKIGKDVDVSKEIEQIKQQLT